MILQCLGAWVPFLLITLGPMLAIKIFVRPTLPRRMMLWAWRTWLAGLFFVATVTVGGAMLQAGNASSIAQSNLYYGTAGSSWKIYPQYTVINSTMHGADGWQGIDIAAGCSAPIYAPFGGEVTANYVDHQGNTVLVLESGIYELTLLHGDYLVEVGDDRVRAGQVLGTENLHGYFEGAAPICHSHVILRVNGRLVNWLEYRPQFASMDYPLRISWYDPSLGGTNCDHDCTTMASGDKVASWIGGRGGVFAAACPRSDGWYHGLRFVLDGVIYECRDTGGWINCYQPGMYDPALRRPAEQYYCWVDLLNESQYQYGSLNYNWGFVR